MAPEKRNEVALDIVVNAKKAKEDLEKLTQKVRLPFPPSFWRSFRLCPKTPKIRTTQETPDDPFGLKAFFKKFKGGGNLKALEKLGADSKKVIDSIDETKYLPPWVERLLEFHKKRRTIISNKIDDLADDDDGIFIPTKSKPKPNLDIWGEILPDTASSGPGPQTAALKGYTFMQKEAADASEILDQQTASLVPQIENLSSAFGDQMGSLRSLVPVMKQASAGMEGMFSDFASKTGPALEKLFAGLLSGKGGSIKDLLGSLKDTAIKSLARLPLAA